MGSSFVVKPGEVISSTMGHNPCTPAQQMNDVDTFIEMMKEKQLAAQIKKKSEYDPDPEIDQIITEALLELEKENFNAAEGEWDKIVEELRIQCWNEQYILPGEQLEFHFSRGLGLSGWD